VTTSSETEAKCLPVYSTRAGARASSSCGTIISAGIESHRFFGTKVGKIADELHPFLRVKYEFFCSFIDPKACTTLT
jgi:hypothetical protein